jgi:ribonuclease PH
MAPLTAELSHLPKTDGSANFAYGGYTITAAVNGPVEAQRRDENPFEALVDVNVRPAAGVGGKQMIAHIDTHTHKTERRWCWVLWWKDFMRIHL